jgi:lysophospholipase L1-like esterase
MTGQARETSGLFGAVIDFDAVLRNAKTLSRHGSRDRLHLNTAGYKWMVRAVDLKLLS